VLQDAGVRVQERRSQSTGAQSLLPGKLTWLALDKPSEGQVWPGSFPRKLCWIQGFRKRRWDVELARKTGGHAQANPCVSRYNMGTGH
jgi:hypothetical protein